MLDKICKVTGLIATLFLAVSVCYAEQNPQVDASRWGLYFQGLPVNPIEKLNLLSMLNVVPACLPESQKLWSLIDQYGRAAYRSKSDEADALYAKIETVITDAKNPCLESLMDVYLVASSAIHPFDYTEWSLGDGEDYSSVRILPMLAISLIHHERIIFLTPRLRAAYGAGWEEKSKEGDHYLADGAFDCQSDTLFIDPNERPLNVAGTFIHELNHLYRETSIYKSYSSVLDYEYKSINGGIKRDALDFADELSAILESSLWQIQLTGIKEKRKVTGFNATSLAAWEEEFPTTSFVKIFKKYTQNASFNIENDLTLFSKSGPLMGLFQDRHTWLYYRPLLEAVERGDLGKDPDHWQGQVDALRRIVSEAYFTDSDVRTELNSTRLFYPEADDFRSEDRALYPPAPTLADFLGIGTIGDASHLRKEHLTLNWNKIFRLLSTLVPEVVEPSGYCSVGAESSYVGFKFPLINPKDKGTGHGKPGERGSKPEENSVKPSIHPCIDLKQKV